jgi:DNA-binding transcriptional regulator YiaG
MFAVYIVGEADRGRRPEDIGEEGWDQLRALVAEHSAGLVRYAAEVTNIRDKFDTAVVSNAFEIMRSRHAEKCLESLAAIRAKHRQIPVHMRRAYWDGLLDWARQQIASVKVLSDRKTYRVRLNLSPPELDRLVSNLSGVDLIRQYALGDWMTASSQQMMLSVRNAIARGEFVTDRQLSLYPIAEISAGELKAHAEIRPTDFDLDLASEAVLQNVMQQIAESLQKRGVHVAEVGDVLMFLWSRQRESDGWAKVTLDDICEQLRRTSRSGRKGGYEPRARDAVREAVEKVARVKITVRDLPVAHKMRKGTRVGFDDPVVMIRNRWTVQGVPVQSELWGPTKWDAVSIQPGAFAMHAVDRNGAEFLIRSRKLFALDDYRHRAVKLLGHGLENLFRINATAGPTIRLRVSTLLGYADIGGDAPQPEDREALESALDKLVDIEVLRGWQYAGGFSVDGKVRQRMTSRRLEEWLGNFVELEAAQAVAEQYAPIAQKALEYAEKARKRTERTAKKAAQEKAPPAGLGAELRAVRTRLKASVLVAGEDIGISAATVSRIENGAKVSEQVADKIRAWLKTAG